MRLLGPSGVQHTALTMFQHGIFNAFCEVKKCKWLIGLASFEWTIVIKKWLKKRYSKKNCAISYSTFPKSHILVCAQDEECVVCFLSSLWSGGCLGHLRHLAPLRMDLWGLVRAAMAPIRQMGRQAAPGHSRATRPIARTKRRTRLQADADCNICLQRYARPADKTRKICQ